MASATADRLASIDELDAIVDTDAHVTEGVDDFLPYMHDRDRGLRKMVERAAFPLHDIYAVSHPLPPFQHSKPFGDVYEDTPEEPFEAKLDQMDEFGLDYSILNPTVNLALATVSNSRLAVALARAYNDWIVDTFLDHGDGRILSSILAAPQRPDLAAEEIDRLAGEDAMVAVHIPETGLDPPAGHPRYDPIYEAASANDLPVLFHSGSGATGKAFPVVRNGAETYAEDHAVVHPFSNMWTLTSLLFQGLPERFPGVDWVLQESGIAWVPYMVWRLDDHYLELADELPILTRLPSEYVAESVYFTTQPLGHTAEHPEHLAWAIEMAGAGNVMYSSDLPHPDFDPPEELFDRIRSHFDAATVRGIMGETAREVFDLR